MIWRHTHLVVSGSRSYLSPAGFRPRGTNYVLRVVIGNEIAESNQIFRCRTNDWHQDWRLIVSICINTDVKHRIFALMTHLCTSQYAQDAFHPYNITSEYKRQPIHLLTCNEWQSGNRNRLIIQGDIKHHQIAEGQSVLLHYHPSHLPLLSHSRPGHILICSINPFNHRFSLLTGLTIFRTYFAYRFIRLVF